MESKRKRGGRRRKGWKKREGERETDRYNNRVQYIVLYLILMLKKEGYKIYLWNNWGNLTCRLSII